MSDRSPCGRTLRRQGGLPVDTNDELLKSKVSRRRLLKTAGAATGAAVVGATTRSAAMAAPGGAPMIMRRTFQGENLTVLYMQSGTYDEAARLMAPDFEKATGATIETVQFPYQ